MPRVREQSNRFGINIAVPPRRPRDKTLCCPRVIVMSSDAKFHLGTTCPTTFSLVLPSRLLWCCDRAFSVIINIIAHFSRSPNTTTPKYSFCPHLANACRNPNSEHITAITSHQAIFRHRVGVDICRFGCAPGGLQAPPGRIPLPS